jgi:hypothetical protein
MPSLPQIPGKNLVTDTTKRARVIAGAAGAGAVAVGGLVAKRVLGGRGGNGADSDVDSDPIAQAPTAPPDSVPKAAPPTRSAAPKPPKAKPVKAPSAADNAKPAPKSKAAAPPSPGKAAAAADKTKPAAPEAVKPKPPAPKAKPVTAKAKVAPKAKAPAKAKAAPKPKAKAKPPTTTTGTDAPPNPAVEPGNISGDKEPHHALNSPVGDPDLTEFPDPFDKRDDPRDPVDPDGEPFGEEPHPATGSESTSEPPLSQDPTVTDGGKPPKRDKLDD